MKDQRPVAIPMPSHPSTIEKFAWTSMAVAVFIFAMVATLASLNV